MRDISNHNYIVNWLGNILLTLFELAIYLIKFEPLLEGKSTFQI